MRRVGRVKLSPLVLKRGMFVAATVGYADTGAVDVAAGMVAGAAVSALRRHGRGPRPGGDARCRALELRAGLPLKVTGPALNAKTGEIAVEELHIAHEGLRLEATAMTACEPATPASG